MFVVSALVCLGFSTTVQARPPENADPALAPWFQGLRQPGTNMSCCSMADCRETDYRIAGGHYEAVVHGKWLEIPPDKVLNRTDNPTGRAVVCWSAALGIMCFVRGPEV